MKMNKKKLAVVSLVLCVAAIISMGSLAWFTAYDTVTNELEFVTEFEMDLYETDEEGNPVVADDGETTIGQTYENIRPGDVLHKDPTVVNKCSDGGEDMWVRMTVTRNNYDVWEDLDLTTFFEGYDSAIWTYDGSVVSEDGKEIVDTYYLTSKLAPTATATLFTAINIPENLTIDQAKEISDCKIIVTADAIQAAGDGLDEIEECKDAFDLIMPAN